MKCVDIKGKLSLTKVSQNSSGLSKKLNTIQKTIQSHGRHSGQVVISVLSGCSFVFLGKTSHIASLHSGVLMSSSELFGKPEIFFWGVTLQLG